MLQFQRGNPLSQRRVLGGYWLVLLGTWLTMSGCFSGAFTQRHDPFTGKTTRDARVGHIDNAWYTFYIHAHRVGERSALELYVGYQAPLTVDWLYLLVDGKQMTLRCWFVKEGRKATIFEYRKFNCDLTKDQANQLANTQKLAFRILKQRGQANPTELANLGRVLR